MIALRDRVTTASRTARPLRGTVVALLPRSQAAIVQFDTEATPQELPVTLLRRVAPDVCPDCGSGLSTVDGLVGDGLGRHTATFVACNGCEFCQEVEA